MTLLGEPCGISQIFRSRGNLKEASYGKDSASGTLELQETHPPLTKASPTHLKLPLLPLSREEMWSWITTQLKGEWGRASEGQMLPPAHR